MEIISFVFITFFIMFFWLVFVIMDPGSVNIYEIRFVTDWFLTENIRIDKNWLSMEF